MPRAYAVTDLILRVKQRTDRENDPSIDDDEWARLITEAYGELYTIVVESGMAYFETAVQRTTTGTNNTIDEPSDILELVAIAYIADAASGRYIALRELMSQERTMMSGLNVTAGSRARAYAPVDDKYYLYPTPPAGQVYEIRYIPQPPELGTGDSADLVVPDGLAFLLWNVAVMAHAKGQVDPQLAMTRLEQARERFTASVHNRSLYAPRRRVLDIETDGGVYGDYWSLGWDS